MGIFYRNQPVYEDTLEDINFESFTEAIGAIVSFDSIVKVFSLIVHAVDRQIQKIIRAIKGFIEKLRSKTRMKKFQKKLDTIRKKHKHEKLVTADDIKAKITKLEAEREEEVKKMPTLTPPDKNEYFVANFEDAAITLINDVSRIEKSLDLHLNDLLSDTHSFSRGQSLSDSINDFYNDLNVDSSEGASAAARKILDTSNILLDYSDTDEIDEDEYYKILEQTQSRCKRACTKITDSLEKIPKQLKIKFDGIIKDMRHETEETISNYDITGVQKSVSDFTAFVTNMSTAFIFAVRNDDMLFTEGILKLFKYQTAKLNMKLIEKNVADIDEELRKLRRQLATVEKPTVESYKIFKIGGV